MKKNRKHQGAEAPTIPHVHFHLMALLEVPYITPALRGVLKSGASLFIFSGE